MDDHELVEDRNSTYNLQLQEALGAVRGNINADSLLEMEMAMCFELYFRAVSEAKEGHIRRITEAVIVNPEGLVITALKKPIPDVSSELEAPYVSLLEGLKSAIEHGISRLNAYTDHGHIVYETSGHSTIAEADFEAYKGIKQHTNLIDHFRLYFLSSEDLNRAMEFAHIYNYDSISMPEAKTHEDILLQTLPTIDELKPTETLEPEQCVICCEDREARDMITVKQCNHKFCNSCLKRYVAAKMENGILRIPCPGGDCLQIFDTEQCRSFLSNDCYQKLIRALAEAEIPESKRIYCPFPKCSALMERDDCRRNPRRPAISRAECMECHRLFCADCKVPWHAGLTCATYRTLRPSRRDLDERKFQALSQKRKWKVCPQCHRILELAYGCYHMTCRCGFEFCFRCLAKYVRKKPTCRCPLFDEENLLLRRVPRR